MGVMDRVNSPADLKKLNLSELKEYSEEVKQRIIEVAVKNGGHLASNLGAADFTIALHYVFDCPKDKIIFDVGHQSYTHKLITGRRDRFDTIRTEGGISGFENMKESEYDAFTTGHASTSLSAGLGLACARDILGEDYNVISVIGDGALTGGMAYEALNEIGASKKKMLIVLNDNKMSISKNVGSVSQILNKLRMAAGYSKLKMSLKRGIDGLPVIGPGTVKLAEKVKRGLRLFVSSNKMFEQLGIRYYGVYDGHNIADLIRIFSSVKNIEGPSLVHIITEKGKGYSMAEADPEKYHGISGQNAKKMFGFGEVAAFKLISLAKTDPKITVVTAAMLSGTGMNTFKDRFPDRTFDVGIAEEHAVTLCAAMAANGLRPFFAVYSTFLQRGFDQLIHDVANNGLPVTFLIDRAGINGADGVTHQGVYDISYLSMIPGMTVLSPANGAELAGMIEWSLSSKGPVAIRYPKAYYDIPSVSIPQFDGRWHTVRQFDPKKVIIASGYRMINLAASVKGATVVAAPVIKPLDEEFLMSLAESPYPVVTLEDGIKKGGFGEAVRLFYYDRGISKKVVSFGCPDEVLEDLSVSSALARSGMTAEEIAKVFEENPA